MRITQDISRFVQSLTSFITTRSSLLHLEWQVQKHRLAGMVFFAVLASLFALLGIVLLSLTLIAYFWETEYRFIALWVMVGVYLLLSIGCLLVLRSKVQQDAFKDTKNVLRDDLAYFSQFAAQEKAEEIDKSEGNTREEVSVTSSTSVLTENQR